VGIEAQRQVSEREPTREMLSITADGAAVNAAAVAAARLPYRAGFHDPLIEQITHVIAIEMHAETSSGKLLVDSLVCSLAARVLHGYSNVSVQRSYAPTTRMRLDRRRLQRVLEFIEAHIGDDLNVAALASTACLSQFHFARVFKTATGESPHQYVSARRLEHAKALLIHTDRPLANISQACGFSSQGNFSRAFRRATGVTPSRYRRFDQSLRTLTSMRFLPKRRASTDHAPGPSMAKLSPTIPRTA